MKILDGFYVNAYHQTKKVVCHEEVTIEQLLPASIGRSLFDYLLLDYFPY